MNITLTRALLIHHLIALHEKKHFFELQAAFDIHKDDREEQEFDIVRDVALAYLAEVNINSDSQSDEFLEILDDWVHLLLLEYYHEETLRKFQSDEDTYTKFFSQF